MTEATQAGLSFSSEGFGPSPTPSSPSSQTQEADDSIRISDDNAEYAEEVCVGSLDKFLSSNKRVRKLTWQRSLLELDKNLQKICGPSPSIGSNEFVSHSLCNSPVNLYKPFIRANSVRTDNAKEENNFKKWDSESVDDEVHNSLFPLQLSTTPPKSHKSSNPKSPLRRSDSLWESTFQKFVPVRHIETHNKLHNQLLKITRGDKLKNNPSFSGFKNDILSSAKIHHPSNNFESDCTSGQLIDLEIDFQRIDAEDLTVQVDKNGLGVEIRYRQICESSCDVKSKKFKSQHKIDQNCLCLLKKDGGLRICKSSDSVVDVGYHLPCGQFYLPVIKGDDTSSGEYTISFFVPEELNFEDLSVKTIDDYLHIIGQKRRYSANYVQQNFTNPAFFNKSLDASNLPHKILDGPSEPKETQQFHIKLRFPGTVDTRSVFSYMNHHHIFIIKTDGVPK